jgi:uridine monophosphate synthetase
LCESHGGIDIVSTWADIVSVHLISGPDIIEACKPCMVFGITEMSSEGSLTNGNYNINAVNYCVDSEISGIVTQSSTPVDDLLRIVPGIKLEKGKR